MPKPAGQMGQGRGQPEPSNIALMARSGPKGCGERAEVGMGLGGVGRLVPVLRQMHARTTCIIHVEDVEATWEAWQGCPRPP